MEQRAVVVAGGGPTGLMLAAELALADVEVVIVEPRPDQDLDGSRAGGLHPRTLEILDERGVVERFVAEGQLHPVAGYAQIPLDVTDLPTRHNHVLGLWQRHIERILAHWVLDELGVPIRRGQRVVGLRQDDDGVEVSVGGGDDLRAAYLVGCDGGRSTVRRAAGIDFVGLDPSTSWMIAEAEMVDPPVGPRAEGGGLGPVDPTTGAGPYRVVLKEPEVRTGDRPTLSELRDALVVAYGDDFGVHDPTWISRFTDAVRQASTYRDGRVLLAGDAAHIHSPHGGQGLNLGVQDAANLGWKLAQVVHGHSPAELLDTYHDERHPVGARVLQNTMAQVASQIADDRHRALHATLADLLALDEPRRRTAAMITGLDVRYELGSDHPLVGRRMPDVDLHTAVGPQRACELLRSARPVLLHLGDDEASDLDAWSDRLDVVAARSDAPTWELPVVGSVDAPSAVLIRPDGYVAWVGQPADPTLEVALTRWFGSPARPRSEGPTARR